MRKNAKIILCMVILCVLCASGVLLWHYFPINSYTRIVNANWGLELPSACARDVYSYSEPSPHGDGLRYHVVEYSILNDNSSKANSVARDLDKIFLNALEATKDQISYTKSLVEKMGLEDDLFPNWDQCKLIYLKQDDNSELFLFYLSKTRTIYILEFFL